VFTGDHHAGPLHAEECVMFDQNGAQPVRPLEAWGDEVHPAQPRHGALPGGVTGGNSWRGLLIAAVVVLAVVGVAVWALLS
jgi:hypothetical protein